MAAQSTRFVPILFNNKKIGELEDTTYDIESGDDDLFGTEGWAGASDGATTCKATANTFVPVKGISVDIITAMLNKQFVDIKVPWNGAIHTFTGRVKSAGMKSDSKTGKCTGSFTFMGGLLKVIG